VSELRRRRPLGSRALGRTTRPAVVLAVLGALVAVPATVAQAEPSTPVRDAAQVALAQGAGTAVALLDLTTGRYSGAGDDTVAYPSESVVKVLIAVRLLLTGQMDGATEPIARRMIAASDDAAATALYARAGGDTVVAQVAAHYGIADLGAPPPVPGRWGLTRVTARGLVELYAALAADPAVGPWLTGAMSATTPIAADGTDQTFGLLAVAPGAAVKQGWGHDGVDSGRAIANSTGYLDHGRYAVAILTSGAPQTYGAPLEGLVTAQARRLVAAGLDRSGTAGTTADPPAGSTAAPSSAAAAAPGPAPGASAVRPEDVPRSPWVAPVAFGGAAVLGAAGAGWALSRRLRIRAARQEAERRARRRQQSLHRLATTGHAVVRLPSGQLVRVRPAGQSGTAARFHPTSRPPIPPGWDPASAHGSSSRTAHPLRTRTAVARTS
jgi:hypothetical protein